MPGRGPTTFQKRQKEQARKEKREEKLARRHQKKAAGAHGSATDESPLDETGTEDSGAEDAVGTGLPDDDNGFKH